MYRYMIIYKCRSRNSRGGKDYRRKEIKNELMKKK